MFKITLIYRSCKTEDILKPSKEWKKIITVTETWFIVFQKD